MKILTIPEAELRDLGIKKDDDHWSRDEVFFVVSSNPNALPPRSLLTT